jgi:reverse transcriptase-like protein
MSRLVSSPKPHYHHRTYVDDAIFFGKNVKAIRKIKKYLVAMWECRDLGEAQEFLRMKIWCEMKKIFLDQTDYLNKVVEHALE